MKENLKESMKELPLSERPYERCEQFGPEGLSDAELLAVILRNGCTGLNSLQLARLVLNKDETHKNLSGLCYLSREQLMELPGIGRVKAIQLQAIAELAKRIARAVPEEQILLGKPKYIAQYFMEDLRFETQECVYAAFLDQKCRLLKKRLITKGTVNTSLISPREIYLEALKCNSVYLVLVHNHPSGNANPSEEDCKVTRQLRQAGELLHLPLLDHIIIGDQTYYSFAEHQKLAL